MGMSPDADVGWGVSLGDESGEGRHESIEDIDIWNVLEKEQYKDVLCYGTSGHCDYGYPVVFIKRTHTNANWGHEEVDPSSLYPPFFEEGLLMAKFLDDIGFKGDGQLKLLVVASYG